MEIKLPRNLCAALVAIVLLGAGCAYTSGPGHRSGNIMADHMVQPEVGLVKGGRELSENPTLDEYILFALRESADLKSAFDLYQAALERAPQVSALPEPHLSYGYFIDSIETRVGPMRHRIGLAQPVPWFGKLSLKEDIADLEARAAYYSFLVQKNRLVSGVIEAYFELVHLSKARTVTHANLELLKRWEQVLGQRYRLQAGTQADVIKVQVELGKLEDKLKELDELRVPLSAAFNALLNRETDAPVVTGAGANDDSAVIPASSDSFSRDLLESMLAESPELILLRAIARAKESGIALAHKGYYPDFSIGVDYTVIGDRAQSGAESGDDGIATMFSLSIPINFSRYGAAVREAKHRHSAAEGALESKQRQLSALLARSLFNLSDSKRRVALFKNTLVPKAEEALESTFTAFESGSSSFLDLLDAERGLLEFQLMLSRAQADVAISGGQVRSLIGDYSEMNSK